jgi:hypothetical protein
MQSLWLYHKLGRSLPPALAILLAVLAGAGARAEVVRPYESDDSFVVANPLDTAVLAKLQARGIKPAHRCSDEAFLRRAYLDVIGTLPRPQEAYDFLADRRPDKRAALIDSLLNRDEFADYWSLKWADLLRVKSEFPINLWPNAVQAYHRWIRDALASNMPYDQFARALLTSSGSNFRVPPVNFYRAVPDRDPASLASAVALTFMGTRLQTWPEAKRADLAAFFSRVSYKKTQEWKEEIVELDPAPAGPLAATFPDGAKVTIPPDQDPREVFADWLLKPGNPWFARAIVNRVWSWFLGRGIIHEPDDLRPDNPPVNPELLAYLEKELVGAHYDLRHLYRLILTSRTYQGSCLPRSDDPQAAALFAYYPVRRLDAEVLIDALCRIGGDGEQYTSAIPEPFTFIPPAERTISLADGSISSQFLERFGRPARDTGLESERNNQPTDAQRLYLLNSSEVERRLENSPLLRALFNASKGNRDYLINWTYLALLSRYPTQGELTAAQTYFQTKAQNPKQGADDLAWALINTKEFLYRH